MTNPYLIVDTFERTVAEYAGAPYAVAVESCTAAIFLSLMLVGVKGKRIKIPKHTYPGVACSIIHAGGKVEFTEEQWEGTYELQGTGIIDGALRFRPGMYDLPGTFHCLSFHVKKLLPIGRGGMILLEDPEDYAWLKRARFDGRNPVPLLKDKFFMLGWNMYMQPSDAARGIQLLQALGDRVLDDLPVASQGYPDLSQFPVYGSQKLFRLRPMTMEDAEFMLELKNYEETRQFAIVAKGVIQMEDHVKWLEKNVRYFQVIQGEYEPMGAIRVQDDEVSVWVHRDFRGQGIAKEAVREVVKEGMTAKIVNGNIASMRTFIDVGFKPQVQEGDYCIYSYYP